MEQQDIDRITEKRSEVPVSAQRREPDGRLASPDNRAAAVAIKTILVGASGGSASNGAIELACRFADRLPAHVEGFHVLIDPIAVFASIGVGEGFALSGDVVAEMVDEADASAAQAKASFEEIAARYHLPCRNLAQIAAARANGTDDRGPSVGWRAETGDPSQLLAERARFFDLVVLGRSSRVVDEPSSNTIEAVLARSGRPVLLAPAEPVAALGQAVAIAWNGSPQAVRAIAASLPLLAAADSVLLLTVGDDSTGDIPAVLDHLAWHGITAKHRQIPAASSDSTGSLLLNAAQEAGADMLVMGGYGHQPWREALFGGVTRDILGTSLLPLLLMH
jgi:nucleotide-binding universal stress UspA family protein